MRENEGQAHPENPARLDAAESGACDLCGASVLELHCKIICTRCGFTRDCSDP